MLIEEKVNLKSIKLVIWDLDDTFWHGTLAEQDTLHLIDRNIELVSSLVNKGIMNLICSKNDYESVKEKFREPELKAIWDYFVFSSINWEPKGQRIKQLIQNMQLRDENVLFIDDNISNINEALFYCPKLQTILPDKISEIYEQLKDITKDDKKHSRLNQYKILETKFAEKSKSSSNEEFLYNSNIVVKIHNDCLDNVDRLVELVNRTNQLNFTKIRTTKPEFLEILNNPKYKSGYVSVKDNFGDYGIVGFYTLDTESNSLYHFLFSCRTLGMGIEQYVYSVLNYPKLEVVGDVVNKVEANKTVDWINNDSEYSIGNDKLGTKFKVLYKGPCDLQSTLPYLNVKNENIITEFGTIDNIGLTTNESFISQNIVNSNIYTKEELLKALEKVPFISKQIFNQTMFNENYNFIIYSLLPDSRCCLYRNKKTNMVFSFSNLSIPYTEKPLDITDKTNWEFLCKEKVNNFNFNENVLVDFSNEWEFLGAITVEQSIKNLEYMMQNVSENTHWIFILGSELKPSETLLETSYYAKYVLKRHIEMNPKWIEFLNNQKNVSYINLTDLLDDNSDYTDAIDHFSRKIYYKLAQKIALTINTVLPNSYIKDYGKVYYFLREFKKKVSKVTSFIFSVGNLKSRANANLGKYIIFFGIKFEFRKK